jgi:hypothetical protein
MDTLILQYAPTDEKPRIEDSHLQPYGLESRIRYHAVSLPRRIERNEEDRVWDPACDRLKSDEDANWFAAKTSLDAARGVWLVEGLAKAVKTLPASAMTCGYQPGSGQTCAQMILQDGESASLLGVETCGAKEGLTCYRLKYWGLDVDITARFAVDEPAPTEIVAIHAQPLIVVT